MLGKVPEARCLRFLRFAWKRSRLQGAFAEPWQISFDFATVRQKLKTARGIRFANPWQNSRVFAKHWQIAS
ncbi:MAG: hypothetical protein IJS32_01410, partial [Kiritimatiellae bacterium]|nr:hypothetical protein [Kiritimatiellia bacterium]